MHGDAHALRRLDGLLWTIVILVGGVVVLSTFMGAFRIAWLTFAAPAVVCMLLSAGGWFYARYRGEPALASALSATAQMVAFAAVAAPLSYLAASAALPLQDAAFDAADRALGLDWRRLLAWMNAHPYPHTVFWAAYLSFTVQASVTILALAFTRRLTQLRIFMLAFFLCAIVTIVISGLLPAQGVWGHYGLTTADYPAIAPATRELHLPIYLGLRDGSFRLLTGIGSEGIITFPSLHAALGVIFIVALWPVPVLRWIGAAVNGLMIVATPVDGGHYFIDVIAGLAIAVVCWAAVEVWVKRTLIEPRVVAAYPAQTGLIPGE
jgi:membrane-associated phospholipid phosphatase